MDELKMKTMKTNFLIFTLALGLISIQSQAQISKPDSEPKSEKVQAAKVAYITSKLNLNTQQAQQFWPVFNEFEAARKKIRKQIRQLVNENRMLEQTDDQVKTDIKKFLALKQEELDLEKLYAEKFLKVISPKQLVEYYRTEKEFAQLLLKRLKGGRGHGKRGPEFEEEKE